MRPYLQVKKVSFQQGSASTFFYWKDCRYMEQSGWTNSYSLYAKLL